MIREAHRCLNAVSRIFNGAEGAVPFQDHLYQIEAKAASSGLSASGNFFPVKGLEEVFKGLGPYVDTGVFNGKTGDALLYAAPYADFGAVRSISRCPRCSGSSLSSSICCLSKRDRSSGF